MSFPEVDCGWVPYYREQLDDRFRDRSADAWERDLIAAGVPAICADDTRLEDFVFNDSHDRAAGIAIEADLAEYGPIWCNGPKVQFSDAVGRARTLPGLGQHSASVLSEFGYGESAIKRLITDGVTSGAAPA